MEIEKYREAEVLQRRIEELMVHRTQLADCVDLLNGFFGGWEATHIDLCAKLGTADVKLLPSIFDQKAFIEHYSKLLDDTIFSLQETFKNL